MVLGNLESSIQRMNLDYSLSSYKKLNSKYIKEERAENGARIRPCPGVERKNSWGLHWECLLAS